MKLPFVTTSIGAVGLLGLLLVPLQGCTNLDETPTSQITPGNFFRTEAEVLAGLAGVYAQLRSTAPEGSIYDANEVSTDEIVVPTRGSDWYDNGQWIDLHNQTWSPTSAAAANFFNGAWNSAYTGVARANLFLSAVQNATIPNKAAIVAEGRALRAFYYYILMDMFGGVPIVTTTEVGQHPRNTRRELFDFIERELIAARDSGLPAKWPASDHGRFTPWNGFATLAQTYNAFDAADKRRQTILIGPQKDVLTGQPATVRVSGACPPYSPSVALIFTDTIKDIRSATEGEGPRIYKWPADPAHVAQNSGNDFAWFRLGEIYLIKAEALNEQTPGSATALGLLNALRARTDAVNTPLAGPITHDMILNERLFELFGEGKRRQDLVRFGQYTSRTDAASGLAGGKQARPDYYVLMPIPQTQIDANPMLEKNSGY